jgi:transposase
MEAFSQDLRKRIVRAVKTTGNQTQVAITFQVSRSTVRRLLKLEQLDPDLAPKKRPGRQGDIAPQDYPAVIALLEAKNDLTLQELTQLWDAQHHQKLSTATFSRLLGRLGWSRKKRVWQPPNATSKPEKSS